MRSSNRFGTMLGIAACFVFAIGAAGASARGADDAGTAPATVDPLPPGWKAGQFDVGDVKTGSNSDLDAHFELHSDPGAGSSDGTFADWAKRAKAQQALDSPLTDRQETDLQAVTLGGHKIFEYEITGKLFGVPLHYRVYLVPIRGLYCTLLCWTNPKSWDAAKLQFDAIEGNLK